MEPKVCVIIKCTNQKEALKRIKKAEGHANVVELWLDHLSELDFPRFLTEINLPVIAVCKKVSNGGLFKGTYQQMAGNLIQAMKAGVEYIEIPFAMDRKLIKKIIQEQKMYSNCEIIISYHNQKTPSIDFLLKKAESIKTLGTTIVKIVTHALDRNDAIKMIALSKLLQQKKIRHIVWASGKFGKLSQLLTPTLGCEMMSAALSEDEASLSDLLSLKTLRQGWECISASDSL